MFRTINLNRNLIAFVIPASLLGILILFMKSSFLIRSDTLNFAITADLLIVVPLIYFMLIHKTEIPKTTVVPLVIVGLLIGSYFLPKESQNYLAIFKTWALPVIELSVLTFVILKVRTALKKYKDNIDLTPDFYSALKSTCYEVLPKKLAIPFATEVAVVYYGFFNWKMRKIKENEFTYHKKSGAPALFMAFILVIGIETLALHFLLAGWNIVVAWVLTTLSVYTGVQVLGFVKSLSKRPISISNNILNLKYGILNEVEIPLSDIEDIELSRKPLEKNKLIGTLSPLGEIEDHNVTLHLKKECELVGIYGIRKKLKVIGLHIDEPEEFKEKVEHSLHF